jgi:GNAT superfamily N-acetyltransferase
VFDPELVAYLVALPCHPGFVMPLDTAPTGHVPLAEATCLYVHDVAVAASRRGHRLGDVLWNELVVVAREHGIGSVELVSVQNSVTWWQARGFAISGDAEGGYGDEAVRMAAQIA